MIAFALWIGLAGTTITPLDDPWWDAEVAASLDRAPARKAEWIALLDGCKPEQREGLAYLLRYLPPKDLESLPTEALAKNVDLAYRAKGEIPWGSNLPAPVFLDAVLPHASVTEPRDPMRDEFHDRYLPLVKDCKTPGEAALAINKALFVDYKVVYNTRRLRTDQASRDSIRQGMATCTGLSIMLVEACRSVGVPARVAGIASWPGRGGNHTWVEIWDGGAWHFVGAAEPDPKGLDHAWFNGDAAKAIQGTPRNAVYAVTYRPTGDFFPLSWNPSAKQPGEDVTARYTGGKAASAVVPKLMVEVTKGGERVEADVIVIDRLTGATRELGSSFGPRIDVNRHLTCEAPPTGPVLVAARLGDEAGLRAATVDGETVVRIALDRSRPEADDKELAAVLADRFGTDPGPRDVARKILAALPWDASIRELAWKVYKASPIHESLKKEYDEKTVSTADRTAPYLWRHVGEKPAKGWGLVIAMHGGGNGPKRMNDSQWDGMFKSYYKDHPEAGGYVYLALRAPNDTWNGFYDDAICPMIARLIRQFVIFGEVDPDKVSITGASHGGYGAFVIGPKMPDRFAAVHASASAPTDGETKGENLRNVVFSYMVGEKDTAYGRAERCQAFARKLDEWKAAYGGYPGLGLEWKPGVGHSVPDRDKAAELLKATRNVHPDRVVWTQSDDVLTTCYWVETPHPADGAKLDATLKGNAIDLELEKLDEVAFRLDPAWIDPGKPLVVTLQGKSREIRPEANVEIFCADLLERGDAALAQPIRAVVRAER